MGCFAGVLLVVVPFIALLARPGRGAVFFFRFGLCCALVLLGALITAFLWNDRSSENEMACAIGAIVFTFLAWVLAFFASTLFEGPGESLPVEAVRVHAASDEMKSLDLPGPPFRARVRYGMQKGEGRDRFLYVEFSCALPEETPRLAVASEEWRGKLRIDPGVGPLDVGTWPYLVRTTSASFAAGVLDAPTRALIARIDQLHSGSFLLDARPGQMSIRSAARIAEQDRMQEFIDLSYRLAAKLKPSSEGVEVIEVKVGSRAEATCRVCGCPATEPVVRCGSCGTMHHQDCWDYNGGCSVYACGGRTAA